MTSQPVKIISHMRDEQPQKSHWQRAETQWFSEGCQERKALSPMQEICLWVVSTLLKVKKMSIVCLGKCKWRELQCASVTSTMSLYPKEKSTDLHDYIFPIHSEKKKKQSSGNISINFNRNWLQLENYSYEGSWGQ